MNRKRGPTLYLKIALLLIGAAVLAVCIFVLPGMAGRDAKSHPETAYLRYPFLICSYLLSLPLFAALYQAYRLLTCIDRNQAFSELSVNRLGTIKRCEGAICIIAVLGMLFTAFFIDGDRTAVVMLCFICTYASSVIAAFAAVLQKLLRDAIRIQSDNELTI